MKIEKEGGEKERKERYNEAVERENSLFLQGFGKMGGGRWLPTFTVLRSAKHTNVKFNE